MRLRTEVSVTLQNVTWETETIKLIQPCSIHDGIGRKQRSEDLYSPASL